MSYIIAFVSFEDSTKEFPVQCFRTDIKQGDKVIVRRADQKLRPALVKDLKYLNWDCSGRIECKSDELEAALMVILFCQKDHLLFMVYQPLMPSSKSLSHTDGYQLSLSGVNTGPFLGLAIASMLRTYL